MLGICHLPHVMCHLSPVTCYLTIILCSFTCYESPRRFGDTTAAGGLVKERLSYFFLKEKEIKKTKKKKIKKVLVEQLKE